MEDELTNFSGSIPRNYEDILTPFLFDQFAKDLISRIDISKTHDVLELACGTGCVTKLLISQLPPDSHLTATDLQIDMLRIANESLKEFDNISWDTVDMMDIPYRDGSFDLIICQFGLMLVPQKDAAVREMFRVLKPGGRLIFNVWARLGDNKVWDIGGSIVGELYGVNPFAKNPGPFSMNDADTIQLLESAGFSNAKAIAVSNVAEIDSAKAAAEGLVNGLPILSSISQRDVSKIPDLLDKFEKQLIKELGDKPMRSPLKAWVFEAEKAKPA